MSEYLTWTARRYARSKRLDFSGMRVQFALDRVTLGPQTSACEDEYRATAPKLMIVLRTGANAGCKAMHQQNIQFGADVVAALRTNSASLCENPQMSIQNRTRQWADERSPEDDISSTSPFGEPCNFFDVGPCSVRPIICD